MIALIFSVRDRAKLLPLAGAVLSIAALIVWVVSASAPGQSARAQELQSPSACDGTVPNPLAVATFRWYGRNQIARFKLPLNVVSLAFDGSSMYVLHGNPEPVVPPPGPGVEISKLRASDGATIATFTDFPGLEFITFGLMLFDGQNLWIEFIASNTSGLLKMRASDGAFLDFTNSGGGIIPSGLTFDGRDVWFGASGQGLLRYRADTVQQTGSFVGGDPRGLAFDGHNVWVADASGVAIVRRISDGAVIRTIPIGPSSGPSGIAFDGANMWITDIVNSTVTKIRVHDFAVLGVFPTLGGAPGTPFDGANIWIANGSTNSVSVLRACDGSRVGVFAVGGSPRGLAFDGVNTWVATGATVAKM
jgi:hypothetical protein